MADTWAFRALCIVALLLTSALLGVFGIYGTGAAALIGAGSRLACCRLKLERPPGYLENNEQHEACMLTALNSNASNWYLFTGDRSIVDNLLNKYLVLPPGRKRWLILWFRMAHTLQMLAMTFVAAQKGWDGPAMMMLVMMDRMFEWQWSEAQLAETWMKACGVSVECKTFHFTGRIQMCCAIQLYSESEVTAWMNDILVPHPRREALLRKLLWQSRGHGCAESKEKPSHFDTEWVEMQARLATEGFEVMRRETPRPV